MGIQSLKWNLSMLLIAMSIATTAYSQQQTSDAEESALEKQCKEQLPTLQNYVEAKGLTSGPIYQVTLILGECCDNIVGMDEKERSACLDRYERMIVFAKKIKKQRKSDAMHVR